MLSGRNSTFEVSQSGRRSLLRVGENSNGKHSALQMLSPLGSTFHSSNYPPNYNGYFPCTTGVCMYSWATKYAWNRNFAVYAFEIWLHPKGAIKRDARARTLEVLFVDSYPTRTLLPNFTYIRRRLVACRPSPCNG